MDGAYDPQAIQDAINIANSTTDVSLISQNTGIPQNIIQEVKEHFFVQEHLIQTDQGFKFGRFERTEEDIALWQAAISGFQNNVSWGAGIEAITISGTQAQDIFERLIKHEYVEKKLMELGISFRGLDQYDLFTPSNFGAHDLAPRMTTGNIVPIEFIFNNGNNVSLNNLDSIVQQLANVLKL